MDKYRIKEYRHPKQDKRNTSTDIIYRRTSPNNEWIKTNEGKDEAYLEGRGINAYFGDILVLDYSTDYGENKLKYFLKINNSDWTKI